MKQITEREVYIYREIYYEYMKPMIYNGKTKEDIEKCLKYWCEEFGITEDRYFELQNIDLIQRLSPLLSDKVKIKDMDNDSAKNIANNIPELRCPRRSEQKN